MEGEAPSSSQSFVGLPDTLQGLLRPILPSIKSGSADHISSESPRCGQKLTIESCEEDSQRDAYSTVPGHGKRKCPPASDRNKGKKIAVSVTDIADTAVSQRDHHESDNEYESSEGSDQDSPFTVVTKKDHRVNGHCSKTDGGDSKHEPKFAAYMKGIECNISREAVSHHQEFKAEITRICGPVAIIEARKNCVRFICTTERQREKLLKIETIVDKNVSVTLPFSILKKNHQSPQQMKRWSKGVITRVPGNTTDEEVKMETSAVMARRITRMVDGEAIPTSAVIIAFEGELPKEVFVHLRRYKVSVYIPKPIRCNRCQVFGHRESSYEASVATCSRCSSKRHNYINCPVDESHAKCANCGQNHNAAYKGCIKYKTINKTLAISAKQGISYRDAVLQAKKSILENGTASRTNKQDKATATEETATTTTLNVSERSQPIANGTSRTSQMNKSTSTQADPNIASISMTRPSVVSVVREDIPMSQSPAPGDTLREDQTLCLMATLATAMLWLIKNMPPAVGQDQVTSQLTTVIGVLKELKIRTEKIPAAESAAIQSKADVLVTTANKTEVPCNPSITTNENID